MNKYCFLAILFLTLFFLPLAGQAQITVKGFCWCAKADKYDFIMLDQADCEQKCGGQESVQYFVEMQKLNGAECLKKTGYYCVPGALFEGATCETSALGCPIALGANKEEATRATMCCQVEHLDKFLGEQSTATQQLLQEQVDIKAAKQAESPAPPAAAPQKFTAQPPELQVNVGVNLQSFDYIEGQLVAIPWIGQYVKALYKIAFALGLLIAAVMFMLGGINYIAGGGVESRVAKGKEYMLNAGIGLIVLFSVYLILYAVNPKLLEPQIIELTTVKETFIEEIAASSEIVQGLSSYQQAAPVFMKDGKYEGGLTVPPASSCSKQCVKKGNACLTQQQRDMAMEAQQKTGYPAAVLLAQLYAEGSTFGIKCKGGFAPSERDDQNAKAQVNCSSAPNCAPGFTWECTNKSIYLPPKASRDLKNGQPIGCGVGAKASQGYVRVSGYACFSAPPAGGNIFTNLVNYYEGHKKSCFREARDKYGADPKSFAVEVQKCGYATSQSYADNLIKTMNTYCLIGQPAKPITTEEAEPPKD